MKIESNRKMRLVLLGLACAMVVGSLVGCSSTPSTSLRDDSAIEAGSEAAKVVSVIEIEGASYGEVFEAARDVLGAYRFGINRVDLARGVLTTFSKRSVGIASPWDVEQSTIGQEFEEFANQQERVVRIEFDRADSDATEATIDGVVRGRIEVIVSRVHRPNWRIDAQSVRLSTHARSRDELGRIEPGSFREVIGHDDLFAERIVHAIAARFE